MATITAVGTYLDNGTARTAGEAMTINSGGQLIVRTDTRVHANAPASMTGYLGAITVNEGECFIDASAIRWLAYNTGTGTVPALGTTISQGGVSGYMLGVWANLTSAPTAAAAAMPATGFIKFREVTGGAFAAGALTGISASATGADVAGWLEFVQNSVDNVIPRLGKFKTRGDWFYLDNTTGTRAQVLQVPTNGGGANTYVPGCWIETAPGSGEYDQYPALNGTVNGWYVPRLGSADGYSDSRQKFVKMLDTGRMQIGEAVTFASTYGSVAAQASTYADWNVSATYTLTSNVCTVFASAGHGLYGGETVGLDFTTGGVTDQTGVATVLDAYYFTVPVTNANTSGNVTVRMGATVSFTAHGLAEGNQVGLTVSTGTLTPGTYTVHSVGTANAYNITFPHTTVLTSGGCSALHTLTVARTTHDMAIGNEVYLDFTSGGATPGKFVIRAIPNTGSYTVNYPHSAAITAGATVTEKYHIGFVPASGCKVRIPNILYRNASSAANVVPNATLTNRPEFITTSAGAIDIEYMYGENVYPRFGQAYALKIWHSAFMDGMEVTNLATAIDIDNVQIGHYTGATTIYGLALTSNFAGGTISNSKFHRQGTPSASTYAAYIQFCAGITFNNCETGPLQYVRSTTWGWAITGGGQITLNNCKTVNSSLRISAMTGVVVNSHVHIDRLTGNTNATTPLYAVELNASTNLVVNGVTWAENQHPYGQAVYLLGCDNVKIRNIGSYASPIIGAGWEPNLYGTNTLVGSGGSNSNVKIQRCALRKTRATNLFNTGNTNNGVLVESCYMIEPYAHALATVANRVVTLNNTNLNCLVKGLNAVQGTTGQASVYGTHFHDLFMGETYGRLALCMNEPTVESASYFTMVSGTQKFNSAGGILMGVIGNKAIWEMPYFALGHTGFVNEAVVMSGGTVGNYRFYYQIDTGSGYSTLSAQLTAAQLGTALSGVSVDPAVGFKLKLTIETTSTNTTAITFLTARTTTTESAQTTNFYPLDTVTLTITGLIAGSDVTILAAGTETVLSNTEDWAGTSFPYTYETASTVDIVLNKPGYFPEAIRGFVLSSTNASFPVVQKPDVSYLT